MWMPSGPESAPKAESAFGAQGILGKYNNNNNKKQVVARNCPWSFTKDNKVKENPATNETPLHFCFHFVQKKVALSVFFRSFHLVSFNVLGAVPPRARRGTDCSNNFANWYSAVWAQNTAAENVPNVAILIPNQTESTEYQEGKHDFPQHRAPKGM